MGSTVPPRVFFSFHYQEDIWRVNQVRNSWRVGGGDRSGRFEDASLWEEAQVKGDSAIARLIDDGLENTDATVVLIGARTAERKWVRYEIERSWELDNPIIGVHINRLRNQQGHRHTRGANPFSRIRYDGNKTLGQVVKLYDWQREFGYENLVSWLEEAPRRSEIEEPETSLAELVLGGAAVALGAVALGHLLRPRQGPPGYL